MAMGRTLVNWITSLGLLTYCATTIISPHSAYAQIFRFNRIDIIPVSGTVGKICFEEATGGQKYCFQGSASLLADINLTWPSTAGAVGECMGLSSAGQLGWLTCSGGGGSFTLNGLTASSQTFSFSNDTNVLLSVNSVTSNHQFVVTWSGALAKARQHAATVYTDQNNTYSVSTTQDFGSASLKVPTGVGLAPTALGHLALNETTYKLGIGLAGVNKGMIQSPNTTLVNNVPAYLDTVGRELGAGYAVGSAGVADTLVKRSIYLGAYLRDEGGQVFNVKAFGAVGNGVTQDLAAINLARDAAEVAGGIVFFPYGMYCINATLTAGNGSVSADNTKPPIIFQGSGMALHSSTPQATTLKWCGGNQGSKTPMIRFNGPYGAGGIRDLSLEAGNFTNVVGIDGQQWGQGFIENVSITGVNNGDALKYHCVRISSSGITPSNNVVKSLYINSPGTNGNGVYLTGGSSAAMADAASNQFIGGSWWGTEYALKLEFADGNIFDVSQFQIGSAPDGFNCGIKFVQSAVSAFYPSGNYFRTPFTKGYCGTTGIADIPNAFIPLGECDYATYCNPKTAITSGTPIFQISFPNLANSFRGLYGMEARGNSGTALDSVFFFDNVNSAHNYTGAIAHSKGGTVYAQTLTHRNDGHLFYSLSNDGASSMQEQGRISSWGEFLTRAIPRASLSTYNPPRGSTVHCDGCANDSTCSALAGNSAKAYRYNTSGSFPTGWRCD